MSQLQKILLTITEQYVTGISAKGSDKNLYDDQNDYLFIDNSSDAFYFDLQNINPNPYNNYQNVLNTSILLHDNRLLLNATNSKPTLLLSPSLTILFAILSGIMSLTTILGNILVITAFIIDKKLRSYSNYFILNLSIADLLIGLLIPPYAPFLLANRRWNIGRAACTLWLVFDYVVGSASVLCIVVISLDRYLLVSGGLSYVSKQKVSRAICIMLTVWVIAFLNYAPAIVFWELISGKSTVAEDDCQVQFHDNLPYLTATACVEFFVPLISICTLNLAVYLNIRKRSKGLIRSKNPQFCMKDENNDKTKENKICIKKESITSQVCSNEEPITANNKNNSKTITTKISITPLSSSISSDNNKQPDKIDLDESQSLNKNTQKLQSTNGVRKMSLIKTNSSKKKTPHQSAKSSLSKDRKAARSLFILVFVFVCCWVSARP